MRVPIDEVVTFDCITSHPSTGAATDADSTPTFEVFEDTTDTDIGVGGNLTKRTSKTGNYRGSITASAANGFEAGKWYNVIASATVNSIAGKAVVMRFFCVPAESAAGVMKVDVSHLGGGSQSLLDLKDFADDGYDPSTNKIAGLVLADAVTLVNGLANNTITAAAAAADFGAEIQALITGGAYTLSTDSNGRIRIVDGTGTGEVDTSSGKVSIVSADVTSIQSGLATAAALATVDSIVDDILVDTGTTLPGLIAAVSGDVWDEVLTDHDDVGSTGEALAAAGSAGDPWATQLPGAYGAGSAGKIVGDNLNATVSSRSSHSADDVWSVTTRLLSAGTNIILAKGVGITGFNDLDAAAMRTALGLASANLDTQFDAIPTANENRNAVTGGSYALDTDANGRIRIVDGTGAGEIDTTSGLVKISGVLQTLDALAVAANAEHDATQAAIAALNDISVSDILTTQMTESYAANGVVPNLTQAVLAIHNFLMNFEISDVDWSVKKFDGTEAFVATLNDATDPTSVLRAA